MAVSKVVYGDTTLIDLTLDTVSADKLLAGYTAHSADGSSLTGTATFTNWDMGYIAGTVTDNPYERKSGLAIEHLVGDVSSNSLALPTGSDDVVLSGFTKMAAYALQYRCARSQNVGTVSIPDLTTLTNSSSLYGTFQSCTNLTSLSLPSLTTISGSSGISSICNGCTALTSASFPSLTTISGSSALQSAFYGCTKLTSVDFSALKTVGNASATGTNYRHFYTAFYNCSALTTLTFPALEAIYCNGTTYAYGSFYNCNKLQKLYFPALTYIGKTSGYSKTTAAKNIFYNCSALTEIHFASDNQSAIESSTGYSTAWGSSATIYFDL